MYTRLLADDTQWQEYFQDKAHPWPGTYNLLILVNLFGW